jgi:hypothetical protein
MKKNKDKNLNVFLETTFKFPEKKEMRLVCIAIFHILVLLTASILIVKLCPGKLITGENVN